MYVLWKCADFAPAVCHGANSANFSCPSLENWTLDLESLYDSECWVWFIAAFTGSPTSNLTILGAYFSILPIIFWCLKYVFIYSRYGHFIIYHHFLTYARHFFTNQFFSKTFFCIFWIINWCLKYVFICKRLWSFMIYDHFLT